MACRLSKTSTQWLCATLTGFIVATSATELFAIKIREHLPDYDLELPPEFVEISEIDPTNLGFSHYCRKGIPAEGEVNYVFAIKKLGGVIGREPLKKEHLPAELTNAQISTANWQGFEVSVIESTQEQGGASMLVLAAQIPLKTEAIQVMLAGDSRREAELRADLEMVLKNLEGPSNWIPSGFPLTPDNGYVLLGIMVTAIVIGGFVVYQIAVRQSYSTALGTSFALLVFSNILRMQNIRLREVTGIIAVLGLTGTVGLLLMGFLYAKRAWQRNREGRKAENQV